jgi:hypothetical protein
MCWRRRRLGRSPSFARHLARATKVVVEFKRLAVSLTYAALTLRVAHLPNDSASEYAARQDLRQLPRAGRAGAR